MNDVDHLSPDDFTRYINASAQWRAEVSSDRRTIYVHRFGTRVFVPGRRESDFALLARKAVADIAKAEERDVADVATDLAWRRYDKLHVRRLSDTHALLFDDGMELHRGTLDLIVSGAMGQQARRAAFVASQLPMAVDEYVNQVRMIPSMPGSFIVRALLPIGPVDPQLQLDLGSGPPVPSLRRMTVGILTGARETVAAAVDIANGASLERWSEATHGGVTANMCEAIARLPGAGRSAADVALDIAWTWDEPPSNADPVRVPSALVPMIAAGAEYLRDSDEAEYIISITGLVTDLHRESALGPGDVTVKGMTSDSTRTRSIRVSLGEAEYQSVIGAHGRGALVAVQAQMRRRGQRSELVALLRFEIVQPATRASAGNRGRVVRQRPRRG